MRYPIGMTTLAEIVARPGKRPVIVADMARLLDDEVARKSGFSGAGIKLAFSAVKAIKPTFIRDVIDFLVDPWTIKLEPIFAQALAENGAKTAGIAAKLNLRSSAVADALLSVTDERAQRTQHGTAKKAYEKLRPAAKKHVEEAIPAVTALLERHA